MVDLVNQESIPMPDDILVKAGQAMAKPTIRVQSASIGKCTLELSMFDP